MRLFNFKKSNNDLVELNQSLNASFSKVRQDTDNLYKWINYFYQESLDKQRIIDDLQSQLQQIPASKEEIKSLIDAHYSLEPILSRVNHIEKRIDRIEDLQIKSSVRMSSQKGEESVEKLKNLNTNLKQKIIQKLTHHSKNYIKSVITSLMAKYGKVTALELREMVVQEQGLCSKSSFYRLLEELEKEDALEVVVDGKNKVYLSRNTKKSLLK